MTNNVIVLYPEHTAQMELKNHDWDVTRYRLQRRYAHLMASVEAITTALIGLGFLLCIGLTISML